MSCIIHGANARAYLGGDACFNGIRGKLAVSCRERAEDGPVLQTLADPALMAASSRTV